MVTSQQHWEQQVSEWTTFLSQATPCLLPETPTIFTMVSADTIMHHVKIHHRFLKICQVQVNLFRLYRQLDSTIYLSLEAA